MNSTLTVNPCTEADVAVIFEIINQSAMAYKGAIPADQWHEPYMPRSELEAEIARGVTFYGCRSGGALIGVMGIEGVQDVTLIRHAYVRPEARRAGVGGRLLTLLYQSTTRPVLIGTWKAATWAIRFYEKNGFVLVSEAERKRLLEKYWTVPEKQKNVAVVLADARWRERMARETGANGGV
ncbi:MAG: GCN5-related N-acetyltransferase [Verrucomicrobia bacterium]|nr:GCN5-related N-acetyltransferase [Verrucomicrobiota bacterium]